MSDPSDFASKTNILNLREFTKSAALLSRIHPRLIEQYPSQWIGAYLGKIEANADSLDELIEQLKRKGIRPGDIVIKFISEERRIWILPGLDGNASIFSVIELRRDHSDRRFASSRDSRCAEARTKTLNSLSRRI